MTEPAGFDADAAAASLVDEHPPYPFTWKGEEHHLPNVGMMSSNEAIALADAMAAASGVGAGGNGDGPVEVDPEAFLALLALLDTLVPDDPSRAAIRDMPGAVLAQLLVAWEIAGTEDLGDLGKEPSEPSPPNRAARRSASTSKPKGGGSKRSTSRKSAASSPTS